MTPASPQPASPAALAPSLSSFEQVDAMLGEMAQAARQAAPTTRLPVKPEIQRVRYTHEAMIDQIIMNPAISQNELAAIFGFSAAWISVVINSDAFQAKLAQTRDELVNPELRVTLNERFKALATRSLQVLQEKLSKQADDVPDNLALRAAELGAKALGLGGNAPPQVLVTSEDRLANLAHRLIALRGQSSQDVIDV